MTDRLLEACGCAFEQGVLQLLKNAKTFPDSFLAPIPVVGGRFFPSLDYAYLLPQVCRALIARERFRQDNPTMPDMPLREEACEELENAGSPQLSAVGMFGSSMRGAYWDEGHPPFAAYVSGLMAYKHTPDRIRMDRSLQQEYPPRKLKGLCGGRLYWRSPEMLAFDRKLKALTVAYNARQAAEARSF